MAGLGFWGENTAKNRKRLTTDDVEPLIEVFNYSLSRLNSMGNVRPSKDIALGLKITEYSLYKIHNILENPNYSLEAEQHSLKP